MMLGGASKRGNKAMMLGGAWYMGQQAIMEQQRDAAWWAQRGTGWGNIGECNKMIRYNKMLQFMKVQQYDNEVQHSDDGCSMVQHNEAQQDDEEQHNDRCSMVMESPGRISWSSLSSTEFSYLMYHLLRDDLCSYLDKSKCWRLLYMYYLSLSLLNYWRTYKKNWSRISPH